MTESTLLPATTSSTPSSLGALLIVTPTALRRQGDTTASPPMTATARSLLNGGPGYDGCWGTPGDRFANCEQIYERVYSGAQAELERLPWDGGEGRGLPASFLLLYPYSPNLVEENSPRFGKGVSNLTHLGDVQASRF